MDIKKEFKDSTLIITLSGKLDTVSSPDLEKELSFLNDIDNLIFDLKDLNYVSSAGLRIFLKAMKIMKPKGNMKIINVKPLVKEVFDMTGFSDILNIENVVGEK